MNKTDLSLLELARIYTKVGANAFGGWSTTYVLLEAEFTHKRRLLSQDQLKTAAASGQALPGPAQVIVAAQTSYFLKGVVGSVLATLCYLLPSVLLTIAFSYAYFNYLAESTFAQHTLGIQAAVGGIILGNAYKIARQSTTRLSSWLVVAMAALLSYVLKVPILLILFGFGVVGIMVEIAKNRKSHHA